MNNFIIGILVLILLQLALPFTKNYENKSKEITYTKDVKPILKSKCSSCHGEMWPDKNWMNYEKAFENRDKIKLRVSNKTMPPGNVTEMTDDERKVLSDWVDGGGKK